MILRSGLCIGLLLLAPSFATAQVTTLTDAFNGSGGLTIGPDGNIYVADFGQTLSGGGQDVWQITPDGVRTLYATGLNGASGNDFDSQGNLFQSNISAGRISKISPGGVVTTFSTGHQAPVGIVVDDQDNLFVANCGSSRVRMVTPDGTTSVFVVNGNLVCPNGITRDPLGNLYVSNFNNGAVVKITPDKQVTRLAFIPGSNNGHITYSDGFLYVCARGANQIYRVSLSGDVTLIAGSGVQGVDDGPLLEATFSLPNGIGASADGRLLYVNDRAIIGGSAIDPVRVRVIDLQGGTVRTHPSSFGQVKARF